ncbi:DNA repair protein RadC [Patescibacteria group bacterium]|nr:DNA repair protein RadC [Patescibacteria group bacterium]
MVKIKDLPKHKRPREKLLEKGPNALKDHELLAILLRTGYQGKSAIEIAKRILKTIPLKKLTNLPIEDLAKLKGVGKSRAAIIASSFAIGKRTYQEDNSIVIKTPEDAVKVVSFLKNKKREYLVAIYLNARKQLITTKTISIGTLTTNLVHPRELFRPAIRNNAASVIIAHNHPSGDTQPSVEDKKVTQKLIKAGKILGIKLDDHIIITKNNHTSLKELSK